MRTIMTNGLEDAWHRRSWWLVVALLLFAGALQAAQQDSTDTLCVDLNGITLKLDLFEGPTIIVDDIPFMSHGRFYVVKPVVWFPRYYAYEDDKTYVARARASLQSQAHTAEEHRMVIPLRAERTEFEGTQSIVLRADRSVCFSVQARLTSDVPALLQDRIGSVFPAWITGRAYSYIMPSGESGGGHVAIAARTGGAEDNTLASGFRTLRLDTRIGPVEIETSGSLPLAFVDFRKNVWGEPNWLFWLAVMETQLKHGELHSYEVTVRFPPVAKAPAAAATTTGIQTAAPDAAIALEQAVLPYRAADRIIPTPKKLKWLRYDLALRDGIGVLATGGPDADPFAHEVAEYIADVCGVKAQVGSPASRSEAGIAVRLTPAHDADMQRPEAYRLRVSADGATLDAATTEGLANAVKTLRQLLRNEHGRTFVRGCEVTDWPVLSFRGIHFFSGRDARDLQVRMVRDVLGALKLNYLVWQCEYVKWSTRPEIHHTTYGMDLADAKAVIAEARRQHVEIIPLINTFGHSEWLLDNPAFRHLADDPEKPYAYDVTNPDVYRICEGIYEEAIALMRPRCMHIGHDEITNEGFPKRQAARARGVSRVILDDIEHYRKFLAERGIRTMIWGDMFLGPGEGPDALHAGTVEEACERRAGLSKDIIISDWHYIPVVPDKYSSLPLFCREGFDTVGASWSAPENIVRYAKAVATEAAKPRDEGTTCGHALGTFQTTWAGYSFDEQSLRENIQQYAAYVLAAEAAWTGGYHDAAAVPFDYIAEFNRIWRGDWFPRIGAPGWTLNLDEQARLDLRPKNGEWFGFRTAHALSDFPTGRAALGRFMFQLAGIAGQPRALLLAGRFNPPGDWPERVELSVGDSATTVIFAVAATLGAARLPAIAATSVIYDDGAQEEISWVAGETVHALDSTETNERTPILWRRDRDLPVCVHAYIWPNPRPDAKIRSLEFVSGQQGSALIVFGVTGAK